jgi:hypothetical protein
MPSNKDGAISENRDGRLNAPGSSYVRFAPRRRIDRVRIANLLRQSVQNWSRDRRAVLILELNQRLIVTPVCIENLIGVDDVTESPQLGE